MALDLGELVGYLVVDDKRWNFDGALKSMDQFGDRAKAGAKVAGDRAGEAFGDSLVPEAERAGEEAGDKAGEGFLSKSKLGAAAAGAAFGAAFWEALDLDAAQDKLVAQLGASARQAERYGRVSAHLYSNAWGESMDQVNEAIASVVTSIDGMDSASGRQLGRLTSRALDFATAFDLDIPRAVQVADTIIESKLAKNGLRAFDLLTRGAQKVPTALREDLLDAVEEYGQFFHSLGYSGPQAFALLVDASEKGIYGIDKAGDAVKEFTIRATDGSKASTDAYKAIGLEADVMSNKILAGGDDAQLATQKIIDGLLSIEDPSKRAQTAIALFGTPLEDLNVNEIPDFLRNLQAGSDTLDGFRGSSKKMSDDLNGNAKTSITEFTRTMKTELVGYLEDKVIPVIEDDVIPAVRDFANWFDKEGGPALRDFKDDLDPVIDGISDLAGFLNDMPGEAKIAALGGVLAGGAALKVRGGRGGLLGTAGSVLGLAKPVPVFVTNPGFGGGVGGLPGGGGAGGGKGALLRGAAKATIVGAAAVFLGDQYIKYVTSDPDKGYTTTNNKDATDPNSKWADPRRRLGSDELAAYLDATEKKAQGLGTTLDLIGNKKVAPMFAVPGLAKGREGLAEFIRLQIEAGRPVAPYIHLTGIERAMGQIATLNAGLDAIAERGVDNGVPYMHGGSGSHGTGAGDTNGRAGVTNHFHGDIRPYDSREFYRDVQQKSQRASLGGVG